ncbi:hypothetical protein INR49_006458 [Caranx melampygus]|nr:hypothetical protein INR49_006458 [Caranx melampygus]
MATHLDFPLRESSVTIVSRCGPALSAVLESKFGCVAIIEGVDFEDDLTAQRKTVVPEKRLETTLRSGVKVSVFKADLTSFKADAVVNAANNDLQHCGGLAAALSSVGGPQIQKESDDFIKRNGSLKTGDAIVHDAWSLPYKKIIHAVGPQLQRNHSSYEVSQALPQLERAIMSILDRVKEYSLKSVAIPAISSGLFHFPLPLCAKVIVSTVKSYYDLSRGHLPAEILLVNNDEPTVQEMENACRNILGSQKPMMYSQAAAPTTSRPTVQIGSVHVILKRGKIEEQQTDIIVNTTSPDGKLSIGQISSALLRKAGHEMQHEMNSAPKNGRIIITKGYSLHCKEVYHTFCAEKARTAAQKVLYSSVLECLMMADMNHRKSIAFPAIGTGNLNFSKTEAAKIISDAVADFASKTQTKMEVHFVIYPSDNDTFKAFEEQMKSLQQKASHPSSTEAFLHRNEFHERKRPTPQISLRGGSDETTREAERWLSGLLKSSGPVTIRNNFILHFSKGDYSRLSRLAKNGVSIEESFKKGHAEITVTGSYDDAVVAGLQVEAMLCNIQKEFVKEEESDMFLMQSKNVSAERKRVDNSDRTFSERSSEFKKERLFMTKLEKVENDALETLFHLKKKQLQCSTPQRMFQRIPAQFCDVVSRIGFHTECAPPADPEYGEGIYFAGSVKKAMKMWEDQKEEYLYFVEAEVLTGKSTSGKRGLILPPPMGTDPQVTYDSVNGGTDISVIFSGYQALPKYIITCKK